MADEPENLVLHHLRELRAEIDKRFTKLEGDIAALKTDTARIENIDATITRMHADVVDAKATGKEVAVRLTLVEHRLGSFDRRLERIEGHLGLIDA